MAPILINWTFMKLFAFLYFLILKLRYKFNISWFDMIDSNKKYIIFPNHQALVDPQIVVSLLNQKIHLSPVISETYYNMPVLKHFFKLMWAVSMGDLQKGTSTGDDVKNAFKNIEDGIKSGKNILLYPAGQLYSQWYEVIRGKKSAFNLIQILPNNVEILVVKTTWLWWSIWSKAWEWDTPHIIKTFLKALFIFIWNILFLIPKREVKVEIVNMTQELKNIKDINLFNQTLENFYNKDGEEKVVFKKHFFYFDDTKNKKEPEMIMGSMKSISNSNEIDEKTIPKEVKEKIIEKICEMKEIKSNDLSLKSNLINDLYFDSLDTAELKAYIQWQFQKSDNPPILDLKTVSNMCVMAIGKSKKVESLKPCEWNIPDTPERTIYEILRNTQDTLWEKTSILSMFKESFKKSKNDSFVYDTIFGVQSKKEFLLKAYFISSKIKAIHGDYIGIMMPSVSWASLLIIATYLAGKIPVMFNWTVGSSAFNHCVNYSKVESIISVGAFYDKVKNDFLEEHNKNWKFIFLENLLKKGTIYEKVWALLKSIFFPIPEIKNDSPAVILFTSGSESLPKAVSLTHKNIISDITGALYHFPLTNKDILIGFLPPFHSFGFSINTIMPLLTGLKVSYTPDPNDAKTIGELVKHCKVTALTATPTFLNMVLQASTKEDLETLKYWVVGAEKCSEAVFESFTKMCPNAKILEWYGITECSPVISINPPIKPKRGSVGLPVFGSEVKIISLDTQKEVWIKEQGMIYFSGDNVFVWYLDENLEKPFEYLDTPSQAFDDVEIINNPSQPSLHTNGRSKKYYKTWDLGYVDEDGYIFITWRLKRFIKIAGEMISLPFIEWVLNKKYGTNIAVEAKEENGNVKIVLFSMEKLDLSEVQTHLRENGVSNLVKISEIQILEALPVLWTGKMDYKVLKNMISFENKESSFDFSDIEWTIIKKISILTKMNISEITLESEFGKDIHLDSLDVGELVIFIKNNFKSYNHIEIKNIKTVKELVNTAKWLSI